VTVLALGYVLMSLSGTVVSPTTDSAAGISAAVATSNRNWLASMQCACDSGLEGVKSGSALQGALTQVADLEAANEYWVLQSHSLSILGVHGGGSGRARVNVTKAETYTIYADGSPDKRCFGPYQVTYALRMSGGTWKVDDTTVTGGNQICLSLSSTASPAAQVVEQAVNAYHHAVSAAWGPQHDSNPLSSSTTGVAQQGVLCGQHRLEVVDGGAYELFTNVAQHWVSATVDGGAATVVEYRNDDNTTYYPSGKSYPSNGPFTETITLSNVAGQWEVSDYSWTAADGTTGSAAQDGSDTGCSDLSLGGATPTPAPSPTPFPASSYLWS
jgi:ARC6-like, IMS domain